jgi:hypothetical protein
MYPRWLGELNFGTGSPIFFFQYPLPYFASHELERIVPVADVAHREARAIGLFLTLFSILSGGFAFLWCRQLAGAKAGLIAAIIYLTLPYSLTVDLYHRAAIGEYAAFAWLPLALYFATQLDEHPRRATVGVAVSFALLSLTHLFSMLLFAPMLAAYAALVGKPHTWRPRARHTALALVLGIGMAATFLVPFAAHHANFNSDNMIRVNGANYSLLSQLFPMHRGLFPSYSRRWWLLDLASVAIGAAALWSMLVRLREDAARTRLVLAVLSSAFILLTLATPILGTYIGQNHTALLNDYESRQRSMLFIVSFLTLGLALMSFWSLRQADNRIAQCLVSVALGGYFLMTSWSYPLWSLLKPLWGLQFAWRINLVLSLAATGLAALALREVSKERISVLMAALALWLGIVIENARAWGVQQNFRQPVAQVDWQPGSECNVAGYTPITHPPKEEDYRIPTGRDTLAAVISGDGEANGRLTRSRQLELQADCRTPCTVLIRQLGYPGWQARTTTGKSLAIAVAPENGLMKVELPAGNTSLSLFLPKGIAEELAPWISVGSALVALFLLFRRKERVTHSGA